jgi:site-specific DNA recombinase
MKVALYARVSTERQAQEGTIESQIVALREYAAANSLEVLEECIDDGYSGTNLVRPGLDRLRDLATQGMIEAVVMLSPDRLARSLAHQVVILEELQKRQVKPIFTNYKLGDTPEDNLLLGIQGLFSEYERTKLLDRTRRGRIQAARNGNVLGGTAPYGYRLIHKTKESPAHYEVNPVEADTVRLVFRLVAEDKLSLRGAAGYLNEKGILPRSGRPWRSSTLADILRNETYIGNAYTFRHASVEPTRPRTRSPYRKVKNTAKRLRPPAEWIPIPIEAIIERSTYDAVRVQMQLNTERSHRNNRCNQYLLRLLTVCGLCGSRIYGVANNRRTYYRCSAPTSRRASPENHPVSIRQAKLDALVWDALVELMDDPEQLEAHLGKRQAIPEIPSHSHEMQAHEKALAALETEEGRLLDAYRENVIDLEQLKTQMQKLKARRAHLEGLQEALARSSATPQRPAITREMLGDLSARYRRAMANVDFSARRKIVEDLVTQVAIYPGRAVVSGIIPIDNGRLSPACLLPPGSLARGR